MPEDSILISFSNNRLLPQLLGEGDRNLLKLEKNFNVTASSRGNRIALNGLKKNVKTAEDILHRIYAKLEKGVDVSENEIDAMIQMAGKDGKKRGGSGADENYQSVVIKTLKKAIQAYTPKQAEYMKALLENEVTFGAGPAGTGKTYLAVSAAVSMFVDGKVDRIILSRPAVEAGENLGFLPGDMRQKVDPYLRPLYDALYDMLPAEKVVKYMETGEIEIAPLAFMRGRTLRNAFVILDEAQNTNPVQMKMFLTRIGEGTRMAITGDLSQTDLPKNMKSGFRDALEKLQDIEEVKVVNFTDQDSVRHPLTVKIIQAYDKLDEGNKWDGKR